MTPQELKEELAFALFGQGRMSFGKARELAGLIVRQFQNQQGRCGLALHHDTDEFAEDLATLHQPGAAVNQGNTCAATDGAGLPFGGGG